MSQKNIIKELVGSQDVTLEKVEQNEQEMYIYLELERKEQRCPCCGTQQIKYTITDYRR